MEAGSDHFGFDFHQAKARKHHQSKCCKLSSTFILLSNLPRTTRFWNNLHQARSKSKYLKAK
jgi:hypothetical protein